MQPGDGHDAAHGRIIPADIVAPAPVSHREYAGSISRAYKLRREHQAFARRRAHDNAPLSDAVIRKNMHDIEFIAISAGQHTSAQGMFKKQAVEMFDQHRPSPAKTQAPEAERQIATARFAQAARMQQQRQSLRRRSGWKNNGIGRSFF